MTSPRYDDHSSTDICGGRGGFGETRSSTARCGRLNCCGGWANCLAKSNCDLALAQPPTTLLFPRTARCQHVVLNRLLHKSGTFVVVTEGWQISPHLLLKGSLFPRVPSCRQVHRSFSKAPQFHRFCGGRGGFGETRSSTVRCGRLNCCGKAVEG